jgi:hypothetical protein
VRNYNYSETEGYRIFGILFSNLYEPLFHDEIFCYADIKGVEEEQAVFIKVFDKNKFSVFRYSVSREMFSRG